MSESNMDLPHRRQLGPVELAWEWRGTLEQPLLQGQVLHGPGLPFVLTAEDRQCGHWVQLAEQTLALTLVLQREGDHWWFLVRQLVGVPEPHKRVVRRWRLGARVVPDRGELELPSPWSGTWALRGGESTWLDLDLRAPGMALPTASLGVGTTEWRTNLPAPLGRLECSLSLDIAADSQCTCHLRLPVLNGSEREERLQRWPAVPESEAGLPPEPWPPSPSPVPGRDAERPALGAWAPLRQLGFLTLAPPSADQGLRHFVLENASVYYRQLLGLAETRQPAALHDLAEAFLEGRSPWGGQSVSALETLPPPFAYLAEPGAEALLEQPLADRPALQAGITQLLGLAPAQVLALPLFSEVWARLANSYLSRLILNGSQAELMGRLDRGLRVLALIRGLYLAPLALISGEQIGVAQQARPLLDSRLFPLPLVSSLSASPAVLLGIGRLFCVAEPLRDYALGALAEGGETPRRRFCHGMLERREARLRDQGPRVLLHWCLDAPGEVLLNQLNGPHGPRWTLPTPPWLDQPGSPGVAGASELDQQSYLNLARRYGLAQLLAAPQQTLQISQQLNRATDRGGAQLSIPAGYRSWSLTYGAPPGMHGQLLIAGHSLDLSQPRTLDLPGLSGVLPFTLVSACPDAAVSLRLLCRERHYAVRLATWQARAYQQLNDAYQQALDGCWVALQASCVDQVGGLVERLVAVLQAELLNAVQAQFPDDSDQARRRALQLEPWLRRALPWQHGVWACARADQAVDGLPLGEQGQAQPGIELLQTAQWRLTLALDPQCTARLWYLLRSGGRLWLGEERRIPVFAEDSALDELWQALRHQSLAPDPQ
ncbi:MAG: hypothetical protein ABWY06_16045 [Pseudomonas sp.]|uniref:hypothetical protein n=1 Tax=Pseudomonas sp. TaxID=306 RepID=UPI0033949AD7